MCVSCSSTSDLSTLACDCVICDSCIKVCEECEGVACPDCDLSFEGICDDCECCIEKCCRCEEKEECANCEEKFEPESWNEFECRWCEQPTYYCDSCYDSPGVLHLLRYSKDEFKCEKCAYVKCDACQEERDRDLTAIEEHDIETFKSLPSSHDVCVECVSDVTGTIKGHLVADLVPIVMSYLLTNIVPSDDSDDDWESGSDSDSE